MLPGFCDSHLHFRSWALARSQLDLTRCACLAETLRAVGAVEPGGADWMRGRGWRSARWPDGEPTAAALDAVTGERPTALSAHDGHTLWVNSAALGAAGRSHPTGVLHEREAWAFPLPEPSPAAAGRALREAIQDANARGVVAVHDLEFIGGRGLWQRLDADRRLTLRVHMGIPVEAIGSARAIELRSGFGSPYLRVGPVKVFMDGTMGSQTAWMLDGTGDVLTTQAELEQIVLEAAAGGLDVAVHAIGDAANRAALNAFQATRETWSEALMRPRIEHVQSLADQDLPRFAELGVIASVQPTHATSDRDVADPLLGERSRLRLPHPRPARVGRAAGVRVGRAGGAARSAGRHPRRRPPHRRRPRAVASPAGHRGGRRGARVHRRRRLRRRRRAPPRTAAARATWPTWWCWTPTSSPTPSGSPTPGSRPPCWPAAGCTTPRPGSGHPDAI